MVTGSLAGILLLVLSGEGEAEPQSEGVVTPSCCTQVFVSSSGGLADTQSAVLGIYTLSSQKIAGNVHPVYLKSAPGQDYYLYFRDKDSGPRGWLVGPQLLEDSFFLTTKQEDAVCPAGLYGAWDTNSQRDETFAIECHSDQVKIPCCDTVTVSATGPIATQQGGVLGEYSKVEDVNGHTAYRGGHINASLFYRKAGHGPDGWMIGPEVDELSFMVTTRDKGWCPSDVTAGYDRDTVEDSSLRLDCTIRREQGQQQDPGVPVSPLVVEPLPNRKTISSSARETLINSACFRIICILYLLLERNA